LLYTTCDFDHLLLVFVLSGPETDTDFMIGSDSYKVNEENLPADMG